MTTNRNSTNRTPSGRSLSSALRFLLLLVLLVGALGGVARAEPARRSEPAVRGVELELKERSAAGAVSTLRATLGSSPGDPGQLSLETVGGAFYKLRLRRDHRGVLYLELERSQRGPGGSLKLQAAAALEPDGKRALLARMTRPDGSGLEVSAALR